MALSLSICFGFVSFYFTLATSGMYVCVFYSNKSGTDVGQKTRAY